MAEIALSDRLDRTIDALLARTDASGALQDPELAPLARLAADLRHYPAPEFKARLRTHLERSIEMSLTVETPQIRQGFTSVTPYLMIPEPGLVEFLGKVFGAEQTFSAPGTAGEIHRQVRLGNSMLMIGEGATGGTSRPAALHVYVEDVDATFERAVAAGAVSLGAPAERPYGERSGFVRDPFGNQWYIARAHGASYVPEGLLTVTPFLHVQGGASYIEFLKRTFGAVEEGRHDVGGRVQYARLRIGNAAIELGEPEEPQPMPTAFYLYVSDADAVYQRALGAGAKSLWPPADQEYGERMAGIEDAQGNQWFIARLLAQ